MGFLADSSVKPVSSLAPIVFFCKRSAKDMAPRYYPPTWAAWPHPHSLQRLRVTASGEGAGSKGLDAGALASWVPGSLQSPRQRGQRTRWERREAQEGQALTGPETAGVRIDSPPEPLSCPSGVQR